MIWARHRPPTLLARGNPGLALLCLWGNWTTVRRGAGRLEVWGGYGERKDWVGKVAFSVLQTCGCARAALGGRSLW